MSASTSSELVLNKTNSNKLDYLYEVSVESEVVNHTFLPVINPYSAFRKQQFSPLKVIKSLIKHHPKGIKEYIQVSKVDQVICSITKSILFRVQSFIKKCLILV